ncbi:hypothetical protein CAPTEDRAFT_192744 [Capitella teleta]|uniref:Uncharacterized protein n=1 Tax=Capitella teleta TaxID=283909 RepID=R7TBE3_CAPTE|nr:hypothetical protein CAPTEDRAFT_192744 [Capitella teleta]|eukprot:ELT88797.1 hypothetical protein CAPTEDRAFT_192744 [Capitella teleta]
MKINVIAAKLADSYNEENSKKSQLGFELMTTSTVQTSYKKEPDTAKLLKRETANAKKAFTAALANLTKSRGDVNAAVHVVRQRSLAYREAHAKLIAISTPKHRAKEQARLLENEDSVEGTLALIMRTCKHCTSI